MTRAARKTRSLDRAHSSLDALLAEIRACRVCAQNPKGRALPHEPRPVLRVSETAAICVSGQAPGTRVHASGLSFSDPSGVRLRSWMGVTDEEFYDCSRVTVLPMGFCFPGLDRNGGDLPPRRECAPLWRARVLDVLPNVELILLVGLYAHRWHLGAETRNGMTATVADWRRHLDVPRRPKLLPLPHPSWRNNAWLKRNEWFESDLVPTLRSVVRSLIA